jgi:hypothetical protein
MSSFDSRRKQVIRRILDMESRGQVLGENSVSKSDKALFDEACELFGSWAIALEYAGVRIKQNRSQSVVPKAVVKRIRGRVGRLNSVKAGQVRKSDYKLYRAGIVAFGSWQRALEAAGVDQKCLYFGPTNPKLTNDQIFEMLRQRASDGKSMRFLDFACDNLAVARAIESRFKNWTSALVLAGLRKKEELKQAAGIPAEPDSREVVEG